MSICVVNELQIKPDGEIKVIKKGEVGDESVAERMAQNMKELYPENIYVIDYS